MLVLYRFGYAMINVSITSTPVIKQTEGEKEEIRQT
jgi:hypothetical protein